SGFYRGTNVAGINNAGHIVGSYTEGDNHSNGVHVTHAFIFTGGTWVQTLDTWSTNTAYAAGDVVTYSSSNGDIAYSFLSLEDGNTGIAPLFNSVGSVH